MIEKVYLQSVIQRFNQYKALGDKTFAQLSEDQMRWQAAPDSNSIVQIIQHLHGNMQSRWTNFLTEDGEKPWRQRDSEFEVQHLSKQEAQQLWDEGWQTVFGALAELKEENLLQQITIRTQPLTVVDAINRQLAHYSYHVGQLVFIGKWLKGKDWQNLSIAKGNSDAFNDTMRLSQH